MRTKTTMILTAILTAMMEIGVYAQPTPLVEVSEAQATAGTVGYPFFISPRRQGAGVNRPVTVITNPVVAGVFDLKAAFNSLPKMASGVNLFGGGRIEVNGIYYISTNDFDMTNAFAFELVGTAQGQSALIVTNWNGRTPALKFFSSIGGNPWRGAIRNLILSATTDKTNAFTYIANSAEMLFDNVQISPWSATTNANGEAGGSTSYPWRSTIGLELATVNGQQMDIRNLTLFGCHIGIKIHCDHYRITSIQIEACGDNGGEWNAGDLNSVGCGVMFVGGGIGDSFIQGVHSFSTEWPYVNAVSNGNNINILGGYYSEEGKRSLTVTNVNTSFIFHQLNSHDGRLITDDQTLMFSGGTWQVIETIPRQIIDNFALNGWNITFVGGRLVNAVNFSSLVATNIAAARVAATAYTGEAVKVIVITNNTQIHGWYTNTSDGFFRSGGSTNGIYFDGDLQNWTLVPTNFFNDFGSAEFAYTAPYLDFPYFNGEWVNQLGAGSANGYLFYTYPNSANFPNGLTGNGSGLTAVKAASTTGGVPIAVSVGASPWEYVNATTDNLSVWCDNGAASFSVALNAVNIRSSLAGNFYMVLPPTNRIVVTFPVTAPTILTNKW